MKRASLASCVFGALAFLSRGVSAQGIELGGSVEFGSISAQPGETVAVPVYLGSEWPVEDVHLVFTFDNVRLQCLGYDVKGSEAQDIDPFAVLFNAFPNGEGLFGFYPVRFESQGFRVPAGPRRPIGFLRFHVSALAATGAAAVTPTANIASIVAASQVSVDKSASGGELYKTIYPDTFVAGKVTVTQPSGPRPVDGLVCRQFLDRVRLSFTPSEAYDSIEVSEDGALVATLGGEATSWEGNLPSLNVHAYAVIARRGAATSVPARCDVVAVKPAAPPVAGLTCRDSSLAWSNPVAFDKVVVIRDGLQIADLPGSAQSFADPDAPASLTVYTVVTELEGFRSPETSCIAHGIWVLEAGDVQVPVGTRRVVVPIYATNSGTVQGFDMYLGIDTSHFHLVKDIKAALAGTEGYPNPEYFLMGISGAFFGSPAAGMLYDYLSPVEPEKDLPPGLRQRVVNFIFDVDGNIADGDVFEVRFQGGSFSLRGAISQNVDFYIPGEIRFGNGGVAPVENLEGHAVVGAGNGGGAGAGTDRRDVRLTWRNGGKYETVRVLRDGQVLGEIGGGETSFLDASLPGGIFTYKVSGVTGAKQSFPRSTLVTTFSPPGAFLRGDANHDGVINISDPIATLTYLFLGGASLPCEDAADADDDGQLTISDPVTTLGFLFSGVGVIRAPGVRYPWFDPTPDGLGCAR